MNLASINIAAILPALVVSIFGVIVMVAEPFVSEARKSRLGWLASWALSPECYRLCRCQQIAVNGIRTCGLSTIMTCS